MIQFQINRFENYFEICNLEFYCGKGQLVFCDRSAREISPETVVVELANCHVGYSTMPLSLQTCVWPVPSGV